MADGSPLRLLLMLAFYSSAVVECQITSSPGDKTVCVGEDLNLNWVYGDAGSFLTVTWAFIDSPSPAITILEQVQGSPADVKNNFNVVHNNNNGGITLTGVTKANTGSYKISVDYTSSTSPDDDTVIVTVNDCSTTTTTTSTTTSTTTTLTTSTSTTMTTKPTSTTTTTPTSTISTMPITTTSMRMPITTSTPPTTSTKLSSTSTSFIKSSNEGLSDEMIIAIVVVPIVVIAIVGTIIFFCLFYRLRRRKRKPANHERHKHRRHYKGNVRPVQQHQQQPYILCGRGRKEDLNHKDTKRSGSLHKDDRYNLYNGYYWGSQVKQNPVYKGDRNLGRLYYNETLPRYDAYRSGYTKGHVYPSHTSGYHYKPDYHGKSSGHGNCQQSSYPVYSRQQEYINPSYSYMGY